MWSSNTSALLALCLPALLQMITSASGENVKVAVYYETLCRHSRNFMIGEMQKVYDAVGHIIDLQLVPYGKAQEIQDENGSWIFNCHFGPDECKGNLIQTCAINYYWQTRQKDVLDFIRCMEMETLPHEIAERCAAVFSLEWRLIDQCSRSALGNSLQHDMAVKTRDLNPPLNLVPWVTINGVHDVALYDEYLYNLTELICQAYTGEPPEACKA